MVEQGGCCNPPGSHVMSHDGIGGGRCSEPAAGFEICLIAWKITHLPHTQILGQLHHTTKVSRDSPTTAIYTPSLDSTHAATV